MHTVRTIIFSLFTLSVLAAYVVMWAAIIRRTGRNPWLAAIMLIPGINFLFLVALAVSEWPIETELKRCKQQLQDMQARADSTSQRLS